MTTDPAGRKDRLANQLRQNLKRRKAQARARKPAPAEPDEAEGDSAGLQPKPADKER